MMAAPHTAKAARPAGAPRRARPFARAAPPFAAAHQPGAHHFPHLRLPWAHAAAADGGVKTELAANFTGTWTKDKARSDPMDEAIQLMALSGLMRQAIKLIRGVQIQQDSDKFVFSVLSVFTWFKVTETYPLSGEPVRCRRRDFRGGGHEGRVEVPSPDKLRLVLKWKDPHGGTGEDVFSMPSPDELVVDQVTRAKGAGGEEREVRYRSVYTRKK
ncbi:MAG: hypothetical protein J3K34DRAFT_269105 [Monoraphidium minutum]|nr:MAG: hypothetical protein J3K34DRAFT_269105 [Monoraphidium minutum]